MTFTTTIAAFFVAMTLIMAAVPNDAFAQANQEFTPAPPGGVIVNYEILHDGFFEAGTYDVKFTLSGNLNNISTTDDINVEIGGPEHQGGTYYPIPYAELISENGKLTFTTEGYAFPVGETHILFAYIDSVNGNYQRTEFTTPTFTQAVTCDLVMDGAISYGYVEYGETVTGLITVEDISVGTSLSGFAVFGTHWLSTDTTDTRAYMYGNQTSVIFEVTPNAEPTILDDYGLSPIWNDDTTPGSLADGIMNIDLFVTVEKTNEVEFEEFYGTLIEQTITANPSCTT